MMQFVDLKAQQDELRAQLDEAIGRVLEHGQYILGPEVQELETELCNFSGADYAVSCANGTDALALALMAEDIGDGDVVFVPSFTFVATAEAVAQLGATPFFVDVCAESFNISVGALEYAIDVVQARGMTPRAVIAVDMFGLPAAYDGIMAIARAAGLTVIADGAQSFGAIYKGRHVGTLADYTTTSFFPAKPLGCYGDGGAVFTNFQDKADLLRSLRFHGKGAYKYDNERIGLNSRLDTMQAAILLVKLKVFREELVSRNLVAERYDQGLAGLNGIRTPRVSEGETSAWAQYTIRCQDRDRLKRTLNENEIPSVVYYPIPLHLQKGYKQFPCLGDLSVSEQLANEVLSLPMSPYLSVDSQQRVIEAVGKL